MEHLSNALKAVFKEQDGDEVLFCADMLQKDGKYNHSELPRPDTEMNESQIQFLLRKVNTYNTLDQESMVGQVVISEWMEPLKAHKELKSFDQSVFNMLLHFACKTIYYKNNDPVCRYSKLLRWHNVSNLFGEDTFTTVFAASLDIVNRSKRKYFDWPAYIDHDNKELNALFKNRMTDLHMHLKGSSYNFDMSWLSIMNNITSMEDVFSEVYSLRKTYGWDKDLYAKMYRACAIRLYLASRTELLLEKDRLTFAQLSNIIDDEMNHVNNVIVDSKIDESAKRQLLESHSLEFLLSKAKETSRHFDNRSDYQDLDYIRIPHYNKDNIRSVLSSERELMYRVFKLLLEGCDDYKDISSLFYAYLCYKIKFRNAVVQLNSTVGFHNFTLFEEIKDRFIVKKYKKYLYKAAIESFLINGKERYLETRIVPDTTEEGIAEKIKEIADSIDEKYRFNFSIIFHFIKSRDKRNDKEYRHKDLREDIKKRAFAIHNFRNNAKYQGVGSEDYALSGYVVGIDAANSEIYCRPEVFAQAFRFLKNHNIKNNGRQRPNDLNITYHVGEDFFDIADGLRAVEEAMIYFNLKNGDRLGHCLVLGTDVRKYYSMRYNTICCTKQVLLDNMAWLHHKCKRLFGFSPLCYYLEGVFNQYFYEVYQGELYKDGELNYNLLNNPNIKDNINDYYRSWVLRGNNPKFGSIKEKTDYENELEQEWDNYAENHEYGIEIAEFNMNALNLFDQYHRNDVIERGAEAVAFTIKGSYVEDFYKLLEAIQEQLLQEIESKRISIECNPTSNYKIGEMSNYDEHPILKFYNSGLNTPYNKHDIAVSINTDDQGVFSTSLEREYSLIALAIERQQTEEFKNSPRRIIDWLDKIRQMSVEQQFDNDIFNYK
jgi:hypothetical protein